MPTKLLFSIDLEEFYPANTNQLVRATPVPMLVDRYLELLRDRAKATFFTVGDVARKFPSVIECIASEGHELACHGDRHLTLDQFSAAGFAADLRANRESIESVTGQPIRGFRAPLFSLTRHIPFAHQVLANEGFTYSSSVLPASNPLYGWPEFGGAPRQKHGVWEIPITTGRIPGTRAELPLFGGTYFRVLPLWLIMKAKQRLPLSTPLQSYFHPYDIDAAQEWIMHVGVSGRVWMNALLFFRRRSLPTRLQRFLSLPHRAITYSDFIAGLAPASG